MKLNSYEFNSKFDSERWILKSDIAYWHIKPGYILKNCEWSKMPFVFS